MDYPSLIQALKEMTVEAGRLIMDVREQGLEVRRKEDRSPVTEADEAADRHICQSLARLAPDIPVISEEGITAFEQPRGDLPFWLVDPLDGTRNFVRGGDEFTVNIGVIIECQPVLGMIYIPPLDTLYYGMAGQGAFIKQGDGPDLPIICRQVPERGGVAVISQSHASKAEQDICDRYEVSERIAASSSLKFCALAEARADIYPRTGRTMEWDTAAGDAIVRAAGGSVLSLESDAPMRYGKSGFENGGFLALGQHVTA